MNVDGRPKLGRLFRHVKRIRSQYMHITLTCHENIEDEDTCNEGTYYVIHVIINHK